MVELGGGRELGGERKGLTRGKRWEKDEESSLTPRTDISLLHCSHICSNRWLLNTGGVQCGST